jgi:hypothetical protein
MVFPSVSLPILESSSRKTICGYSLQDNQDTFWFRARILAVAVLLPALPVINTSASV